LCAAAGCTVQDPGIETDDVWECTTDADCISGYDCKGGLCAKHTNPPLCVDLDKDEAFVGEFCAADTVMDCEDTNAAIHPSAPELCNLKDDNCNDQIDEDIALACPLTNGVCAGRNAVQTCVDGNLVPPTSTPIALVRAASTAPTSWSRRASPNAMTAWTTTVMGSRTRTMSRTVRRVWKAIPVDPRA